MYIISIAMIKKFLNSLFNYLSFKLFSNKLPYFYNLFNFFYRKNILNTKILKSKYYEEINSFYENGYSKVELKFSENFDDLKKHINKKSLKIQIINIDLLLMMRQLN